MPKVKSVLQMWFDETKKELLITEPRNIAARTSCCENIVNKSIVQINTNFQLRLLSKSEMYRCCFQPQDHLQFLLNWPGLRVDNSPNVPKTKKEYVKKSKNWLNGRRAPNYGKTLFPFFLQHVQRFISKISKSSIPDNVAQQTLYHDILLYAILARLCECNVSLNEQSKKAPFFCKNSIIRKCKLKQVLQSYAADHEYVQGFPSCHAEAVGYFHTKYKRLSLKYKSTYLQRGKTTTDAIERKENPSTEYWKRQFDELQHEFTVEAKKRREAQKERDTLRRLIYERLNFVSDYHHNGKTDAEYGPQMGETETYTTMDDQEIFDNADEFRYNLYDDPLNHELLSMESMPYAPNDEILQSDAFYI